MGFGEQGEKGIYFKGTGEQRPNFEGNRGRKTILGNIRKQIFVFLGNRGTSQFISGEQGNRYPPERASFLQYFHKMKAEILTPKLQEKLAK